MIFQLQTLENNPFWEQETVLDGKRYLLTFKYNQRQDAWYLDIADVTGEPIASSRRLVADWVMMPRVVDERRPGGRIYTVDTSGGGVDPGLLELGERVLVMYLDAEEVSAL